MGRACARRDPAGTIGPARVLALGLAMLLCVLPPNAIALDPDYLEHWPDVERVLADNRTPDANDTAARQMAALRVLLDGVEYAAGSRRWHGLTADEQALRGKYHAAAEGIRAQMHSSLSNELGPGFHFPWEESPLRAWYGLQWGYEGDHEFREATLRRYVPEALMPQILAETPPSLSGPGADENKALSPVVLVGAVLVLLFVIVGIGRRFRSRRDAEATDGTESIDVELPEHYRELTTAQKDELAVAGRMVLDSLEPYMLAAKPSDRAFPINVLTEQRINGFLLTYSRVALETFRDKADVPNHFQSLTMFHLWIVEPQRMQRLFGAPASPNVKRREGDVGKLLLFVGTWAALRALETFAPTGRLKHAPGAGKPETAGKTEDDDADLSRLRLPSEFPATRLHPHGPNEALAQQRVLSTLSVWLLELADAG
jgi:hypothetical protein